MRIMMMRLKRIPATAIYLMPVLLLLACSCVGALRDRKWERWPGSSDTDAAHSIVDHAILAHGGQRAFDRHPVIYLELDDEWIGFARLRRPWPRQQMVLISDPARSRLFMALDRNALSAGNGWYWDGSQLVEVHGSKRATQESQDAKLRFIMKAFGYLFGLPFNLRDRDDLSYAGLFAKSHESYHWIEIGATQEDPAWYLGFDPDSGLICSLVSPAPILSGNEIQFEAIWREPVEVVGLMLATQRDITARDGEIPVHRVRLSNLRRASSREAELVSD